MRPGVEANNIIGSTLAWAANRWRIRIHNQTFPANHFHLLVSAERTSAIPAFMQEFQSIIARKLNRLNKWRGPFEPFNQGMPRAGDGRLRGFSHREAFGRLDSRSGSALHNLLKAAFAFPCTPSLALPTKARDDQLSGPQSGG